MVSVQEIYRWLDTWAPFATQLGFDNAGLLVGSDGQQVQKIGLALDITAGTAAQAAAQGCELVVSHHPVIFTPLRALSGDTPAYRLARAGIAAICAHTNLDAAAGGVNDALAAALGLTDCVPLADPGTPAKPPLARMGGCSPCTAGELALHVKAALGCGGVKYVPCGGEITRVAVCGGAGGDFIAPAAQAGAQALVTGECRHHERLLAEQLGLSVIEAGHFCTERVVLPVLQDRLRAAFPAVEVLLLEEEDCARYC